MNTSLQEIVACPICKGDLEPEVYSKTEVGIEEGQLICQTCERTYPMHTFVSR